MPEATESKGRKPVTGAAELLSAVLDLEERARNARTIVELMFLMANDTHQIIPYRQVILLEAPTGDIRAVSGLSNFENNAPYILWLKKTIIKRALASDGPMALTADDLSSADADFWSEWLPKTISAFPIMSPKQERIGIMLLARQEPLNSSDVVFLQRILSCYGHAWNALGPKARRIVSPIRRIAVWCLLLLFAVASMLIKVNLTVLAPAEIVARNPEVIRAPMDGIIKAIAIVPNQKVEPGDLLFELHSETTSGDLDVARKTLETLIVQYRQLSRRAVADPRSKARLPIVAGKIEEQEAAIDLLQNLVDRTQIFARTKGTVVLDNVTDFLGKPVRTGEKVLLVADEAQLEIEAWLPAVDAISLSDGGPVTMFLNSDPLVPVRGRLRHYAYEASLRPDGSLAYRIRGRLDNDAPDVRIGWRGTARLTGAQVSLAYWIFRKPILTIRQLLGL